MPAGDSGSVEPAQASDSSIVWITFISRIATIGVMSIMPMRGTIRRSGARTGSVISITNRTIGFSGLGLNHDISARMMIAKFRMKNSVLDEMTAGSSMIATEAHLALAPQRWLVPP